MKKPTVLTSLIIASCFFIGQIKPAIAQEEHNNNKLSTTMFIEFLGNSVYGSANLELILRGEMIDFSIRTGLGYGFDNTINFPVDFTLMFPIGKNFIETGIGATFVGYDIPYPVLRLGIRLHPFKDENLFFRLGYTPYFETWKDDDPFSTVHYGGFSFGYLF